MTPVGDEEFFGNLRSLLLRVVGAVGAGHDRGRCLRHNEAVHGAMMGMCYLVAAIGSDIASFGRERVIGVALRHQRASRLASGRDLRQPFHGVGFEADVRGGALGAERPPDVEPFEVALALESLVVVWTFVGITAPPTAEAEAAGGDEYAADYNEEEESGHVRDVHCGAFGKRRTDARNGRGERRELAICRCERCAAEFAHVQQTESSA